jgi:hypothetical protein
MSTDSILAIPQPESSTSLVFLFSRETLFYILSQHSANGFSSVIQDRVSYLHGYLEDINAKTIVLERDYMDGDYLDDYASYYVKCYVRYKRRCVRLHFFSTSFDETEFLSHIRAKSRDDQPHSLNSSYLGFIVVRPLPDAIIGRTVLKTFPSDGGRRQFRCLRKYSAHLFGIKLTIESLAYQEQDTILAACATVALWCCFNKTKQLFGSASPTPAEITRAANLVLHMSRAIPTSGLRVQQICDAIKHVGLEPEVIIIQEDTPLTSLLYAYVTMGIPIILGVEIEGRGEHALTVVGYSQLSEKHLEPEFQRKRRPNRKKGKRLTMIGSYINKLYAHDDPIGPFSRLDIKPSDQKGYPICLQGSWQNEKGQPLVMRPKVVIIPIYHKIRLNFLHVHSAVKKVNTVFQQILFPEDNLEWDIHLTTTNEYKRDIRDEGILTGSMLEKVLLKQQPLYIWRILFKVNSIAIGELHVDATDIARPLPFFDALWYNDTFKKRLAGVLERDNFRQRFVEVLTPQFTNILIATVNT